MSEVVSVFSVSFFLGVLVGYAVTTIAWRKSTLKTHEYVIGKLKEIREEASARKP